MTRTQRHPYEAGHVRLGGRIERVQPGVIHGVEYDHKFIASTELMASDRGVIFVDAWDWKRYLQRPRWIANHDLSAYGGKLTDVSLGRGVHVAVETGLDTARVGPSGKALVVYVRYASTPFARQVRALYDEGGLDDVSVRWDWRTEVTRNPYQEEVEKYGDELAWVCEHAELVELSAVLMGADSGAQVIRSEVLEAFERCRAKQIELPALEQLIRRGRTVLPAPNDVLAGALSKPFAGYKNFADCVVKNQDQPHPVTYCAGLAAKKHADLAASVDLNAVAEPIGIAKAAVEMIGTLHAAMDTPRQELADAITEVGNLAAVNAPPPEDEEPTDVALAFAALSDALSRLDLARNDVAPAIRAVRESLAAVSEVLGLGDVPGVDVARVLADHPDAVTRLLHEFNRLPTS